MSYSELGAHINPFNPALAPWLSAESAGVPTLAELHNLSAEVARQANLIAFNNAFLLYGWTCFAVIPVVFLWRRNR